MTPKLPGSRFLRIETPGLSHMRMNVVSVAVLVYLFVRKHVLVFLPLKPASEAAS